MPELAQPKHGGALEFMSAKYQIPIDDWLDLSTGIAPFSYPIGPIPHQVWQRLPETDPQLSKLACEYYGCHSALAVAGSQQLIQQLPNLCLSLLPVTKRVWLPSVGYKGHFFSWQQSSFQLLFYDELPQVHALQRGDVLVVINPNNPTAELYAVSHLRALHQRLQALEGLLVVDEAFMDVMPEGFSMAGVSHLPAILVLRSVGKFFGLAGIRLGFVLADEFWLGQISQDLCWNVNGPAIYIAKQALADISWQQQQQAKLREQSQKLKQILQQVFPIQGKGTALFYTQAHSAAEYVFEQLAIQGVYVRLTDERDSLRFGVADDNGLHRLQQALANISM